MRTVEIYTDGACSFNPGPGGYAAILIYNGKEKIVEGAEKLTTNNRMELLAAIEGLKALKVPCNVKLYSDSAYLVNAFLQGWIHKWIMNNWERKSEPIKNVDLWKNLIALTRIHNVTFIKVKGHSDNEYNNRCDEIARKQILALQD